METVQITYERLFNLGNYDHETFKIERQVQAKTEFAAMQKLSLQLAALEEELRWYRSLYSRYEVIKQQINNDWYIDIKLKAEAAIEENKLKEQMTAFKEKHIPLTKLCNCAFCEGKKKQ